MQCTPVCSINCSKLYIGTAFPRAFGILWSDLDETRSELIAMLSRIFLYSPDPAKPQQMLEQLNKWKSELLVGFLAKLVHQAGGGGSQSGSQSVAQSVYNIILL